MPESKKPEPPQFPAGPFVLPETYGADDLEVWIGEVERVPGRLRDAVSGLTDGQLDTTYRRWTIRQIAHHLADSHLNSCVRFKLALTEERQVIQALRREPVVGTRGRAARGRRGLAGDSRRPAFQVGGSAAIARHRCV
jgi:hypothetical protein